MDNKYFEHASKKLIEEFNIDIVNDILLGTKDRILLYADITKGKNIRLYVISGTLKLIGFEDSESILLEEIISKLDRNNKYAEVSGKLEYFEHTYKAIHRFAQELAFSFPIIVNDNRIWVNFVVSPIKNNHQICVYQISNITEMMTAEELNFEKTHRDALTLLFNKYTFDYHYNLRRKFKNLHFIYLDIDNFKVINDTYGHDAGDEFLRSFAQVLKTFQSEYNLFYRIGGDEFVGLFFEPEEEIRNIVESILKLTSQIKINHKCIFGTVSIGVIKSTIGENLILKADNALYEVKKSGKNNYILQEERII